VATAVEGAARAAVTGAAVAPRAAAAVRGPDLEQVWLGLAVLAAALACALQPLEPIDYWWSVRLGSIIRELGTIPAGDVLTYTPVRGPIVDGQWLARVLLSVLHDLGGVQLSLALRSVVAIAAAVLLAGICKAAGAGSRIAAVVAGLSVVLFVPGLAIRPQVLAVIPFVVVWQAGLHPPRSVVGIAATAATVAFWANVHGSFVLIYPLLAVGVLEAAIARGRTGDSGRLVRAVILAAVCGLAPLLNPYGVGLASYVGDAILVNGGGTSVGVLGTEWGAPAIRTAYGGLFYGSVLLVALLLGAGRRPRIGEALLLIGFGVLAVSSIRHIMWWSLVATPFIARGLAELGASPRWPAALKPGPLRTGSPALNAACLALFGMLVVSSLPWWRERLPLPPAKTAILSPETPVGVAEYLAANPQDGRLFNDTDWSAYFTWRLAPDTQVFVDDRFELHPVEVWREYTTISAGHASWERRLEAYGITRLALNPSTQAGLIAAVRESPNWPLVYEDRQALVFARRAPISASTP
jgi:hypothetical protein